LTIDLKNHTATVDPAAIPPETHFNQVDQQLAICEDAFNHSDAKAFEQCLSPDMVLITSKGEFRGRKEVMKHFENYFGQDPPVLVSLTPRGRQAIGMVIWMEYDMTVSTGCQTMKARGTALYQKTGERWLMSNMDYSVLEEKK
jgi:ketosteroid isomerase-like protein